jgi:16S rRNA processing protein RimM
MVVGRIGRPHGLDGSFYVTRPRARMLTLGMELSFAGRRAEIVRRSGTEQRPILRLEGMEDREAAEALRGVELEVDSRDAPKLEEGEWWAHELEGCAVVDGELQIGTVQRMVELPSCEALEVLRPGGGQPLVIPMVKDAIRNVDPSARRIDVNGGFLGIESGTT